MSRNLYWSVYKKSFFILSEKSIPSLAASSFRRSLSNVKSMVSLHVTFNEDAKAANPPKPTLESCS